MKLNKLLTILIIIAVIVLLFRFGIAVVRVAFRFWYITIPVLFILYWKPKKKEPSPTADNTSLDPSKEIKPSQKPIIKDEDEHDIS